MKTGKGSAPAVDLLAEVAAEAQRRSRRPLLADTVLEQLEPAMATQLRILLEGPTSAAAISSVLARHGHKLSDSAIKRWRTSQQK